MPAEEYASYKTADYLETEEDIVSYLEAMLEECGDDPACLKRGLAAVSQSLRPREPSSATLNAVAELNAGEGYRFASVDDLFASLGISSAAQEE
jgi:hypothetical protein